MLRRRYLVVSIEKVLMSTTYSLPSLLLVSFAILSLSSEVRPQATSQDQVTSPNATLDVLQLKQQLLASQERIQSLSIKYESHDYDESQYPKGSYLHRELAIKAPDKMFHVSAHGHIGLNWHDDFQQQRAYIVNRHLFNDFPVNRVFFEYDMKPEETLPGSLVDEFYFVATGIWPLTDITPFRPEGRAYVLREVATSEKHSVVRPLLEQIDGHWCHVLEYPGRDRLWIDVDRGCALMARESYSEINDALVQRMELSDHTEVAAGIWLPSKLRNIQFDYLAHNVDDRMRIIRNAMHTAYDITVNDVNDAVFEFHPAPGSLKRDNAELIPIDGSGEEHLRSIVEWIQRNPPPSLKKNAASWPAWTVYGLYFVPALLICLAISVFNRVASAITTTEKSRQASNKDESIAQDVP
jgi:hypothetical protein